MLSNLFGGYKPERAELEEGSSHSSDGVGSILFGLEASFAKYDATGLNSFYS